MDFDANDDEIWHQGENQFESFEAYWKEATKDKNWFREHPLFIHDDCKTLIRKSLEEINMIGSMENEQRAIHRWNEKLDNQNDVCVYKSGNEWQKNRYAFMSEFNQEAGIKKYGTAKKGRKNYKHIITEKDCLQNFLNEPSILTAVKQRFKKKAGDLQRVLTNTIASQPCCFNLFAPLQKNKALASKLFSLLMEKEVQIQDIQIEFTPDNDESLDDQSIFGGTDADVAVFYSYGTQKHGVILIEFKYIESEFSVCSSYREKNGGVKDGIVKKNIRPVCDSPIFYETLILPYIANKNKPDSPDCGYLKYNNWQLLRDSSIFDFNAIKRSSYCPFRFSLQQLWRNLLLAENVSRAKSLEEFQFWVLCPSQNTWLWQERGNKDVENELRKILTPLGNNVFSRKDIKIDFVDNLKVLTVEEWQQNWIKKFEERYLTV